MHNTYMEEKVEKTYLQRLIKYHEDNTYIIITQFKKWNIASTHSPSHSLFVPTEQT